MKTLISPKGEIALYQTKDKKIRLEVKLEQETVWLTQKQIAQLFGTQRPAITKHLHNIFKDEELQKNSVCSILEHTARDGKSYKTTFYNLDAIISVGYRVNSARATQFLNTTWGKRKIRLLYPPKCDEDRDDKPIRHCEKHSDEAISINEVLGFWCSREPRTCCCW